MTLVDRLLQRWRIAKVRPFIRPGDRVLDVGCGDAALHRWVRCIGEYVGVDPAIVDEAHHGAFRLMRGAFPDVSPTGEFDAIVMLASLEHIPAVGLHALAKRANELLPLGGRVLITVPDSRVDAILKVLSFLSLVDSHDMKPGEHHGFDADSTADLFVRHGFRLMHREKFQAGLNNCFILAKTAGST